MAKDKELPIKYGMKQSEMDMIYKFALQIGNPVVHYDKDKVAMLEEFVEQAKAAAINITYRLHDIDANRYNWTDGKDKA
jgi:hypothetical protein